MRRRLSRASRWGRSSSGLCGLQIGRPASVDCRRPLVVLAAGRGRARRSARAPLLLLQNVRKTTEKETHLLNSDQTDRKRTCTLQSTSLDNQRH